MSLAHNSIRIASFNCKNVKSSCNEISELCMGNDIVLLQETWLSDFETPFVTHIHDLFYGEGVSAMNTEETLFKGRPFGGIAILWRKSLAQMCKIIKYADNRIMGIEIVLNNVKMLILNVYLPYDKGDNFDEYQFYLYKIDNIISNYNSPYAMVLGDFNANTYGMEHGTVNHRFGNELLKFCTNECLVISDVVFNRKQSLCTFYSEAHNSISWLDHIITTKSAHALLSYVTSDTSYVSSDHFPIMCAINVDFKCIHVENTDSDTQEDNKTCIKWSNVSQQMLNDYKCATEENLKCVPFEYELFMCDSTSCRSPAHVSAINRYYNAIVDALTQSSKAITSNFKLSFKQVPGWNDYCKVAHSEAREAFLLWIANGKTKQGPAFSQMCRTRAVFKSALRNCKNIKDRAVADSIAKKFLDKDSNEFWKQINKVNSEYSPPLPQTIDGVTGKKQIVNLWKNYFQGLLNTSNDLSKKADVDRALYNCELPEGSFFTSNDICAAIKKLKSGKSPGLDKLSSENFKYASERLFVMLSLLYNACLLHGYLPKEVLDTVICPIIKDKKGCVNSMDNYRPIAITSVSSKILELLILHKCQNLLCTTDSQFGFKNKHSTDMGVFMLKQLIDYHTSLGSPVYICYLDASKAFDRINHFSLFEKLLKRKVLPLYVRLLRYWYSNQLFCVRWDGIVSSPFKVSNGVRQGGILSPLLFNVYVDDLSIELTSSRVGCNVNEVFMNHLIYADDTVLLAPSPDALQRLIDICSKFADNNEMVMNERKTYVMCVKPKRLKNLSIPNVYLNGKPLKFIDKHKYLGVIFSEHQSDNDDIDRQTRSIYARGNMLIKRFKLCNDDVKVQLFKSYCTGFYCSHLWDSDHFLKSSLKQVKLAFKRIFRHFFQIKQGSITAKMVELNCNTFDEIQRKSIFNFRKRILSSDNKLISTIVHSLFFIGSSLNGYWTKQLFMFQ